MGPAAEDAKQLGTGLDARVREKTKAGADPSGSTARETTEILGQKRRITRENPPGQVFENAPSRVEGCVYGRLGPPFRRWRYDVLGPRAHDAHVPPPARHEYRLKTTPFRCANHRRVGDFFRSQHDAQPGAVGFDPRDARTPPPAEDPPAHGPDHVALEIDAGWRRHAVRQWSIPVGPIFVPEVPPELLPCHAVADQSGCRL